MEGMVHFTLTVKPEITHTFGGHKKVWVITGYGFSQVYFHMFYKSWWTQNGMGYYRLWVITVWVISGLTVLGQIMLNVKRCKCLQCHDVRRVSGFFFLTHTSKSMRIKDCGALNSSILVLCASAFHDIMLSYTKGKHRVQKKDF